MAYPIQETQQPGLKNAYDYMEAQQKYGQMAGQCNQQSYQVACTDAPDQAMRSLTDNVSALVHNLESQDRLIQMLEDALMGPRPELAKPQDGFSPSLLNASEFLVDRVLQNNKRLDFIVTRLGGR